VCARAGNGIEEPFRKFLACVRKYLRLYTSLLAAAGDLDTLAAAAQDLNAGAAVERPGLADVARRAHRSSSCPSCCWLRLLWAESAAWPASAERPSLFPPIAVPIAVVGRKGFAVATAICDGEQDLGSIAHAFGLTKDALANAPWRSWHTRAQAGGWQARRRDGGKPAQPAALRIFHGRAARCSAGSARQI
jgi:hypothetical protein